MNLVEWLQRLMTNFGAEWVMWLMLGLSVISVAVMLERAWFFWSVRDDVASLAKDLRGFLAKGDVSAARKRFESSPSAEAAVVVAGLIEANNGAKAAEDAMAGASSLQRLKLERGLAYLGTLGNNAPFIGLFGTVIGVVQAFEALGDQKIATAAEASNVSAPAEVMAAIAEALVATAIGLAVAIPAVAMFNVFQRQIRAIMANTDALGRLLVAHLSAVPGSVSAVRGPDQPSESKRSSKGKSTDEKKDESGDD